tara:strand:- start:5645 stop:6781 length:1137 start_codon:yes stop_codon:yes gene_type:complete
MTKKLDLLEFSNYPKEHEEALITLDKAALKSEIAQSPKAQVFHREGYWKYLVNIKLEIPFFEVINDGIRRDSNKLLAASLGEYISIICKGDINKAIDQIDIFTRSVSFWIDKNNEHELLKNLQQLCRYLRDICKVISRHKVRADRYIKNAEPSIRDLATKGFCLLCSQPSSLRNEHRCDLHIKSKTTETQIRKIQRFINNAYINLNLYKKLGYYNELENREKMTNTSLLKELNVIDKKYKIKKDESFRERCFYLEGWVKHLPIQQNFVRDIELLEETCLQKDQKSTISVAELKILSDSIIGICRKYEHTRALFDHSTIATFHFDLSEPNIFNFNRILLSNKANIHDITKENVSEIITVLIREAQFCLIRKASNKNQVE